MVKAKDIYKVRALFLQTPMINNEVCELPVEQLDAHEKQHFGNDGLAGMFNLLAKDYENQKSDDQLYPAKASDKILKMYPPTFIWTQEFDILRRASTNFAERLRKVGRLVDIDIMPGCAHAMMGCSFDGEIYKLYNEEQSAAIRTVTGELTSQASTKK